MTMGNEHQQTLQDAIVEANNIANDLFSASSPIATFVTNENNYITVIAAKSLFRMLYLVYKLGVFTDSVGTISEKVRIADILDVLYCSCDSPNGDDQNSRTGFRNDSGFNGFIGRFTQMGPCEIDVAIMRECRQYRIASELTQRQARIILIEALREL